MQATDSSQILSNFQCPISQEQNEQSENLYGTTKDPEQPKQTKLKAKLKLNSKNEQITEF